MGTDLIDDTESRDSVHDIVLDGVVPDSSNRLPLAIQSVLTGLYSSTRDGFGITPDDHEKQLETHTYPVIRV